MAELEDGQVHGHHDAANDHAQEHDDDGLHEAGEASHHVVDFGFVEVGRFAQHVVDRARLFADGRHLQHHRREQVRVGHRAGEAGAGRHFLLNLHRGIGVDRVARSASHGVERFDQRHASGEHRGEGPGPARHARLVDQRAENREAQQQPVHHLLHALVAFPGLKEEVDAAADHAENQPPVGNEKLADGHHDERGGGQIRAERAEHLLEGRDHENHDDGHHDERHHDHRGRVHEGRLDLRFDRFGLLHVGREPVEQLFQNTGRFAGLHQVAVEVVEVLGKLAECGGERRTGFDVAAYVVQQPGHVRVGVAPADDVESLEQWHAGLHHRCQLAREDRDVLGLDRLAAPHATLLDLGGEHALPAQRRLNLVLSGGPDFATDGLAVSMSHVFRRRNGVPIRALELATSCLLILLRHAWGSAIPSELGIQLLVLLTFLAAAAEVENGAPEAKFNPTEELRATALSALAVVFRSIAQTKEGSRTLMDAGNVPAIAHTVTTVLHAVADTKSNGVSLAGAEAINTFVTSVKDREVLASFFPGIVSAVTKTVTPSQEVRRPYKVLQLCLNVITRLFRVVLTGQFADETAPKERLSEKAPSSKTRLDQSWLEGAAAKIRLALSNILKLRDHERREVRVALEELCLTTLQECYRPLRDSAPLALEALLALSQHNDMQEPSGQLSVLIEDNNDFAELLRSNLYDAVASMPQTMLSNDESLRQRGAGKIATSYRLLKQSSTDITPLDDHILSKLQESMSAILADSKHQPYVEESTLPANASASLELSTTSSSSKSPDFLPIAEYKGRGSPIHLVRDTLQEICTGDTALSMAQQCLDEARSPSEGATVTSFWLALNILRSRATLSEDLEEFLALETSPMEAELRDELYTHALSVLTRSEDEETRYDWREQALSLEAVAFYASCLEEDFRPELSECLFPVLHILGGRSPRLREHAIVCLNTVAASCGYSNAKDLVISNVDYLVNGIGLKLNTFDISPQAPQVLLMLVEMVGPRLLPYLDDLVNNMFDALDCFHGYPTLVELLFSVLRTIVKRGVEATALSGSGGKEPRNHLKTQPHLPTIGNVAEDMRRRAQKAEKRESQVEVPEETPRRPWKELRPTTEQNPGEQPQDTDSETNDTQPPEETPSPTPTRTYTLLHRITLQTQHHLPNSSPAIRTSLLTLLSHSLPYLSHHEDTFLPLVHTLWPVLTPRLADPEMYVVCGVLDVLSKMCEGAGDFVSRRVEGLWPVIRRLHERTKDEKAAGKGKARGLIGMGRAGTGGVAGVVALPGSGSGSSSSVQPRQGGSLLLPIRSQTASQDLSVVRTAPQASESTKPTPADDHTSPAPSALTHHPDISETYTPTTTIMLRNSLTTFLVSLVAHAQVSQRILAEIVSSMLWKPLVVEGRADVQRALERVNADAVWLALARLPGMGLAAGEVVGGAGEGAHVGRIPERVEVAGERGPAFVAF